MVDAPEQVTAVRAMLVELVGGAPPPVGAMIETVRAVEAAQQIAEAADFVSLGTNDLTAAVLGADRFAAGAAAPHDPRVLAAIATVVEAAHAAGRAVEVCGEAASEPVMIPLLAGLGVDELSVGAARVGETRAAVRALDGAAAARLAQAALRAPDARAVVALVGQRGDAAPERLEGDRRVVSVGPEP